MTDSQPSPSAGTQEHKPAGSPVRLVVRIILFAILAYLLVALPYDYLIARPGQKAAWRKISNERQEGDPEDVKLEPGLLQKKNMGSGDVSTTNETVAETIGRKPSHTEKNDKGETIETYSWRGGLPWKTYNIYVVYTERKNKLRLENAFLNERPTDLSVPLQEPEKSADSGKPSNDAPGTPGPAPIVVPPQAPSDRPEAEPKEEKKDKPEEKEGGADSKP